MTAVTAIVRMARGPKSPSNSVWASVWSVEREWQRAAVAGEKPLLWRYAVVRTNRAQISATARAPRPERRAAARIMSKESTSNRFSAYESMSRLAPDGPPEAYWSTPWRPATVSRAPRRACFQEVFYEVAEQDRGGVGFRDDGRDGDAVRGARDLDRQGVGCHVQGRAPGRREAVRREVHQGRRQVRPRRGRQGLQHQQPEVR